MTRKAEKEIELEHDAWSRFQRAVDVVAKSPPQHRTKASKATTERAKRIARPRSKKKVK
jgi:hypothetical protein